MNSMPRAVWMSAEAARAVFPLAGSRRWPWSGRIGVVRRFVFITLRNTREDTAQKSDDQDLDLAVADGALQRRWVGGRRRKPVCEQLAGHGEDGRMAGTTKAV